jgi:hypothetical protein
MGECTEPPGDDVSVHNDIINYLYHSQRGCACRLRARVTQEEEQGAVRVPDARSLALRGLVAGVVFGICSCLSVGLYIIITYLRYGITAEGGETTQGRKEGLSDCGG